MCGRRVCKMKASAFLLWAGGQRSGGTVECRYAFLGAHLTRKSRIVSWQNLQEGQFKDLRGKITRNQEAGTFRRSQQIGRLLMTIGNQGGRSIFATIRKRWPGKRLAGIRGGRSIKGSNKRGRVNERHLSGGMNFMLDITQRGFRALGGFGPPALCIILDAVHISEHKARQPRSSLED